jgi:drug/metabolite transporter (DMT)-like permease
MNINNSKGVFFMLLGVLIVPWLDGFAKLLGQSLPFLEVAWARFAVQFILVLPLAFYRFGRNMFKIGLFKLQIIRGTLLVFASTLFFASLRTMEIADAIAVFFVHPLLTVMIAPILLNEKVRFRQILIVLVGFSGSLLVIRPGMDNFDWNSLYALATGVFYSGYIILGRRLVGKDSLIQVLLINGLVGTLLIPFGVILIPSLHSKVWIIPIGIEWIWIISMGSIGMIGHYFITKSLEYSSASRLAPLGYFEIIGSVFVGLFAFGDLPNIWTWTGIVVIVVSGLYVSLNRIK